ncbi:hypothetical protein SLS62_004765 [Diatrype stigma]|uniref:Thiaminase-2/PQQC domain-containing protein n=1 Tax=Diatrype stigma TaxID=117547 RepID=A0AAN9YQ81_9PEZI
MSPSIIQSLLSSPDIAELYERATRTEFLALAGQGRLPRDQLSQWLAQDRLYCQAYARFIGGLISRVRLPLSPGPGKSTNTKTNTNSVVESGTGSSLEWRILTLLHGALGAMMTELRFFESTAADYGLDLAAVGSEMEGQAVGFGPNPTTREYIELFDSFAAQPGSAVDKSLFEGLLVLWITEKAYLDSWSYAKQQQQQQQQQQQDKNAQNPGEDLDGGALRERFIGNWTSDEFKAFVAEIEACLEALAAAQVQDSEEVLIASSLSVVKKVLVLEEAFWPFVA